MILRNTSGQPILIGPLLLVADGTEQTTGAAIVVRKDGVDVGAPGGTLSYVSSGVWQYIPSQGESDCRMLGLILSKASSVPVPMNVPTTRIPDVVAGNSGGIAIVGSAMNLVSAYDAAKTAAQPGSAMNLVGAYDAAKLAAPVGAAMTLTGGERTAIANEVENQIIDESDPEKVLAAITAKIAEANPDLSGLTVGAIASATASAVSPRFDDVDAAIAGIPSPPVPPTPVQIADQVASTLNPRFDAVDSGIATLAVPGDQMNLTPEAIAAIPTSEGGGSTPEQMWTYPGERSVVLQSTAFDALPMTLTGKPTNPWQWVVWLIHRFRKSTKNKTTGVITVFGSDQSVAATTQQTRDVGSTLEIDDAISSGG